MIGHRKRNASMIIQTGKPLEENINFKPLNFYHFAFYRLPNSSKRNDDYKSSSRGGSSTIVSHSTLPISFTFLLKLQKKTIIFQGNSDVSSFKRPLNDVYPKRNDLDTSSRSTSGAGGGGGYEPRGGVSTLQTGKDHRFNDAVDNRGSGGGGGGGSTSFGRNRVDDRDVRLVYNIFLPPFYL